MPPVKEKTAPISPLPNLIETGALPVKCGLRIVDDNPMDPLGQPKVVKGEPTKPGAYPWQVTSTILKLQSRHHPFCCHNGTGWSSRKK